MLARRLCGAVARAVVEHEHLGRERHGVALARDRVEPAQQKLALGGVHDAVGQLDLAVLAALLDGWLGARHGRIVSAGAPIVPAVRVHVVDPSAFTPPYDDALCRALAAAGAEVKLYTSRFAYAALAPPEGYERREFFYRASPGVGRPRLRLASKLLQHVPDMLRYRAAARAADVVHFQWLTIQHVDRYLLPARRSAAPSRRSSAAAAARVDRPRHPPARAPPRTARRTAASV